jgi:hypothetical protein
LGDIFDGVAFLVFVHCTFTVHFKFLEKEV